MLERRAIRPRVLTVLAVALYVGLVRWLYIAVIYPSFAYSGLRYQAPGAFAEILSWVLAVAPATWLPLDFDRPSRLPLWLQYLIVYLPTTFVPLYNAAPSDRTVWPLVAAILGALVLVQLLTGLPRASIPAPRIGLGTYRVLLLTLAGVLLAPLVALFGVPTHLPSLSEVYDVRADYKSALLGTSTAVVYLITWFGRVAAPMLVIEGVAFRKWIFVVLGLFGTTYAFAVSGMKTTALIGFFLIGLRVLYGKDGRAMGLRLAGGLLAGVLVGGLIDTMIRVPLFTGLFVRRGLLIPGLLNGYYYQFFSAHPLGLLGGSFLRSLAGFPYDAPAPTIIGVVYFGTDQVNANVNLWGDAFLNFGVLGILTFAVVLGVLLWLFDSITIGRSRLVALLMLGVPALTLTNSPLPTTFLTNGLALTFLLALLLPPVLARSGTGSEAEEVVPTTQLHFSPPDARTYGT